MSSCIMTRDVRNRVAMPMPASRVSVISARNGEPAAAADRVTGCARRGSLATRKERAGAPLLHVHDLGRSWREAFPCGQAVCVDSYSKPSSRIQSSFLKAWAAGTSGHLTGWQWDPLFVNVQPERKRPGDESVSEPMKVC